MTMPEWMKKNASCRQSAVSRSSAGVKSACERAGEPPEVRHLKGEPPAKPERARRRKERPIAELHRQREAERQLLERELGGEFQRQRADQQQRERAADRAIERPPAETSAGTAQSATGATKVSTMKTICTGAMPASR